MARFQGHLGNIYGKLGNQVFIRGGKKGNIIRKPVRPGTKKNEPALRAQYLRTGKLNRVAADISSILNHCYGAYREKYQYQRILGKLRKADSDKQILLLSSLAGFDLRPRYGLHKFVVPILKMNATAKSFNVLMNLLNHPEPQSGDETDYYYELTLVQWCNKGEDADVIKRETEWVKASEPLPAFRLSFTKPPNAKRWMLILRLVFGKNQIKTETWEAESVRIMAVGSYLEQEKKLLKTPKVPVRKAVIPAVSTLPRVKRL
jgi:hypothetical protein